MLCSLFVVDECVICDSVYSLVNKHINGGLCMCVHGVSSVCVRIIFLDE